jgi:predicted transcriptional regulator YdeE
MMISKLLGIDKSEPQITTLEKPYVCLGMKVRTDQKMMMSDLPKLYEKYLHYKEMSGIPNMINPWEYISLSDNFENNDSFDYHTGYAVSKSENVAELDQFSTPTGTYAVFKIRNKNKITFGISMGLTKRFIYQEWLPKSTYDFAGYEFEYNNEAMNTKNPYDIDLYVAVKQK